MSPAIQYFVYDEQVVSASYSCLAYPDTGHPFLMTLCKFWKPLIRSGQYGIARYQGYI